jgi:Sulfotransferase family
MNESRHHPAGGHHAQPASEQRVKVVYVLGAGRSGSTILGVALGNCDGVFFAGELNKWLPRSGTPSLDDPERTRFWRTVRADVPDAARLFGHQTSCLERSSTLFEPRRWCARRRLRRDYRRVAQDLYRATARAAHATHVVDTSHYPLRAREMQGLQGVELYLLYLVRDPQAVVASLGRRDVVERSFDMPRANAYLWLTNVLSLYAFLRQPRDRRLFVRHETFRADPRGVLRQILDSVDSPAALPDMSSLRTGVALHGNRLIRSQTVALEAQAPASVKRSFVTALLQLPWTAVFARLRPTVLQSPLHGGANDG